MLVIDGDITCVERYILYTFKCILSASCHSILHISALTQPIPLNRFKNTFLEALDKDDIIRISKVEQASASSVVSVLLCLN